MNYSFQNFWKTGKYWYRAVIIHSKLNALSPFFSNFELITKNTLFCGQIKNTLHRLKNWWRDMFDNISSYLKLFFMFKVLRASLNSSSVKVSLLRMGKKLFRKCLKLILSKIRCKFRSSFTKKILKFPAVIFWLKISRSFTTNSFENKVPLCILEPIISLIVAYVLFILFP